jgi:hypothetical protein
MDDEVEAVIVNPIEAQSATIDAEIAASNAERAAQDAEVAAALTTGAALGQSILIESVMEHAREDAQENALDAEEAAQEAEAAAEVAVAVNTITAEMYDELLKRIDALENKQSEQEVAPPAEEQVAEIGPEAEEEEAAPEEGNTNPAPAVKRRKHGRRR